MADIDTIPDDCFSGGQGIVPNSSSTPGLAARLQQMRSAILAQDAPGSVRVATQTTLAAYTRVGNVITANANGALAAVNGVTLVVGDRILLRNGAAGADNGIYEVTSLGGASAPYVLTRAADADTSAKVTAGQLVFASEGTVRGNMHYVLTTNDTITLNTTSLVYDATQPQRGTATLASGTATVGTTVVITASSRIQVSMASRPTGSTDFAGLAVVTITTGVPGTGSFVVEAIVAAGTIDADAAGTVHWTIWD